SSKNWIGSSNTISGLVDSTRPPLCPPAPFRRARSGRDGLFSHLVIRRPGPGVGHTPDRGGPTFSRPFQAIVVSVFLRQKVWTSQAKCLMMPSDILFEDGLDHGTYPTRRYRHGVGDSASALERGLGNHSPSHGSSLPARGPGALRDGAKAAR